MNNIYSPGFGKQPVEISVHCDDDDCTISGNVEVNVTADGETILDVVKVFSSKAPETKKRPKTVREKKRRRSRSKSSKEETDSVATSSEHSSYALESDEYPFHFPTFGMAKDAAYDIAHKVWDASTRHLHFYHLPDYLRDNEFLHSFHRPPTPSIALCFKSIFRLHTETGNIWTHMLGCALFVGMTVYFLTRPDHDITLQDKVVFSTFFIGAIICLGTSFLFHTMICYSERVGRFFNKLDYAGILLMIIGSFVPWVYYGFYCHRDVQLFYLVVVTLLGLIVLAISMMDQFSGAAFRPLRAVAFSAFGLFGVFPFGHFIIAHGFHPSLLWLLLMAVLYLFGGFLYAARIPERFFPGKCDLWWQSHQIFHVCVVIAAIVHYHGCSALATTLAERRAAGGMWCQYE